MKYCLIALGFAISLLTQSVHADTPHGNYLKSCNNIAWNDGLILIADCKDKYGRVHPSSIYNATYTMLDGYVSNQNGNLIVDGLTPGGSWMRTCNSSSYDLSTYLLSASCTANDGGSHNSRLIAAPGQVVFNNNGNLITG